MSHQAGIKACEELKNFFANCKSGNTRLIQISINEEELVLQHSEQARSTCDEDWDSMVLPLLKKDQPTYIMFRLDEQSSSAYLWVFISYSPDFSPVRQKMLYAASKATLRNEFGTSQIKEDLFGTVPGDVDLSGYRKHLASQNAPKPLTHAEEELAFIRKNEVHVDISVDSKHQTVQGISFPLSQQAIHQLQLLKQDSINYIQLSLDTDKEIINLAHSGSLTLQQIQQQVPKDHGRYHMHSFKHMHEGVEEVATVFFYTMPGYNCPIKERMLYSTCKAPLLEYIEKVMEIPVDKKLELSEIEEITTDFFYNEVHPVKNIVKKKFDKPKGPAGRGPKRMTKAEE